VTLNGGREELWLRPELVEAHRVLQHLREIAGVWSVEERFDRLDERLAVCGLLQLLGRLQPRLQHARDGVPREIDEERERGSRRRAVRQHIDEGRAGEEACGQAVDEVAADREGSGAGCEAEGEGDGEAQNGREGELLRRGDGGGRVGL
jgi:hypothetical protein